MTARSTQYEPTKHTIADGTMNRRTFLRQGAALSGGLLLSGCLGQLGFETQSAWRDPPLVEDRPDAVYYPAIIEGMGMYGTTVADVQTGDELTITVDSPPQTARHEGYETAFVDMPDVQVTL